MEIIGAVFPVPQNFIYRFFDEGKDIFIKFLTHETTKLRIGNKILFYESNGSKKIIGEGIIKKMEFLTADEVSRKYKKQLFLTKEEMSNYVGLRECKKMMAVKLFNITKYEKSLKPNKPVTMTGFYLNKEDYNNLFQNK